MPDPEKMHKTSLGDGATLNVFQKELVQMVATLNGDCRTKIYPHKLVEKMTVEEAIKYVEDGYRKFCEGCEHARNNGADESEIIVLASPPAESKSIKAFAHKMFSCFSCVSS